MTTNVVPLLKSHFQTRRDWCIALTAFTPVALVLGRAVADVSVSIVAILFLIECIVRRQWTWIKEPWVAASLGLWLFMILRTAFVPDNGRALLEAFTWLRYFVFAACVAKLVLPDNRAQAWLLHSTLIAVLALTADGFVQYVFGHDILGHEAWESGKRLTGPYNRPILGITIANLFAAPIFWLLGQKKIFKASLVATLCFAGVFVSGDRMGLVLAAFVVLIWLSFLARSKPTPWKALAAMLGFVAFLVFLTPTVAQRQLASTAHTAKNVSSSAYGLVWKSAWNVGKDSLFWGVGLRQFRNACVDERYGPLVDSATGYKRCYTHPHNAYLEWFSEGGLIGLFGFTGFVLAIAYGVGKRLLARHQDLLLWGLAAMLAMRLMPLFVSTSFFNNWSAIPFWLAVGWAMSYKTEKMT